MINDRNYSVISHEASALKIGLFGIGLDAYWPQFEGLEARLRSYVDRVADKLGRPGVEVVNLGLVDSPAAAVRAGRAMRAADVDLIFLHVTTYALSHTVLPVIRKARVPVVVLNLQPSAAIDYESFNRMTDRTKMTGEWLAYCAACPVPEISNVFHRAGIPFHQVTGVLDNDPACDAQIDQWVQAARVAHGLESTRVGLMGHYYNGMLDIYTDLTQQAITFGVHFEILEVEDLAAHHQVVDQPAIDQRVKDFREEFEVQPDCKPQALQDAARTSLALDRLVAANDLGAMAYFYKSVEGHPHQDLISSIILGNSRLTARGVPIAGEYEIKNVLAMKIMSLLGVGGSFTEYYAMDFNDDVVLMGHDGPGHTAIAQGKTKVRPLEVYHGKVGQGLSVEMSVRTGLVTLLSVVEQRAGGMALLVAEGESVDGPILEIGNTNSRYRFPLGARGFVEAWNQHGPAHHCAVGIDHVGGQLEKLGALLGIPTIRVC